jgi:hypothetical protein
MSPNHNLTSGTSDSLWYARIWMWATRWRREGEEGTTSDDIKQGVLGCGVMCRRALSSSQMAMCAKQCFRDPPECPLLCLSFYQSHIECRCFIAWSEVVLTHSSWCSQCGCLCTWIRCPVSQHACCICWIIVASPSLFSPGLHIIGLCTCTSTDHPVDPVALLPPMVLAASDPRSGCWGQLASGFDCCIARVCFCCTMPLYSGGGL